MSHLKSWRRIRLAVQLGFVAIVLVLAVQHQLAPEATSPSLHSLCPFGAIASIGTILTAGVLVPKLHPSNIVLGLALLASLSTSAETLLRELESFGMTMSMVRGNAALLLARPR